MLAALGDVHRLGIVEQLVFGDASPGVLAADLGIGSNLLAHHLNVLTEAGVLERVRSEGDRRRSYVRLRPGALDRLLPAPQLTAPRVLFVCTHNSARSQLAAATWRRHSRVPVCSAGTLPARRVHPRAVRVGRRHGLALAGAVPVPLAAVLRPDDLVVAVCDNAHEDLSRRGTSHLHWSVPDPARAGTDAAFEHAYDLIEDRVGRLAATVRPAEPRRRIMSQPDLTLDQTLALRLAAERLGHEFDGVFGTETIERFLHSSYSQFASAARLPTFLPLIAERFARQQLKALARVEGKASDGLPTVLFLCVHNAGRSQMAMGFFSHFAGERAVAWSGGSEPGSEVNPAAIEAMAERGIDISGEFPKPWTDEIVRAADVVITMGCGDACPLFPGKRYEDWVLEDPAGKGVEAVRPIRDEIERRVRHLLDELDIPAR